MTERVTFRWQRLECEVEVSVESERLDFITSIYDLVGGGFATVRQDARDIPPSVPDARYQRLLGMVIGWITSMGPRNQNAGVIVEDEAMARRLSEDVAKLPSVTLGGAFKVWLGDAGPGASNVSFQPITEAIVGERWRVAFIGADVSDRWVESAVGPRLLPGAKAYDHQGREVEWRSQ